MSKVAESMTAGSSATNDYSMKRSRLGEQRKAETESLRHKAFSFCHEDRASVKEVS
jgi:hypothetical protein